MEKALNLSVSAQLTNCNVGPCGHIMAHIGACCHSAFSTIASVVQQLFLSPVLTTFSFAGLRQAQLFFKWTEPLALTLARVCPHECLLGRSFADIMRIKQ